MKLAPVLVLMLLMAMLSGCASSPGSGLVPGKSTAADAEARMGAPNQRLKLANGDSALYFSRLPFGRAMYVVTVGPDGAMRSIEQRMQQQVFARVVPNSWTKDQVGELLGPPGRTGRFDRMNRDWWEYRYHLAPNDRVVWVQFSNDGVVREMYDMVDPDEELKRDGNRGM